MMLLASVPGMSAALFVLWVDRHARVSALLTGVQTCALPISGGQAAEGRRFAARGPPASHATPARDTTERPADAISRAADTLLSRGRGLCLRAGAGDVLCGGADHRAGTARRLVVRRRISSGRLRPYLYGRVRSGHRAGDGARSLHRREAGRRRLPDLARGQAFPFSKAARPFAGGERGEAVQPCDPGQHYRRGAEPEDGTVLTGLPASVHPPFRTVACLGPETGSASCRERG